ncbi:hypothetical protein THAOC_00307, partial [Thalassiosira oceanica]
EAERLEKERIEAAARLEQERLEAERLEKERIEAAARLDQERLEAERLEKERIEAAARLEQERLEAERLEKEQQRLEAEKVEAQRLEAERLEQERIAVEEAERLARLAREEERRLEDRWKETIDGGARPPSRLDSLRGAFLAAGSLMRSSAAAGPRLRGAADDGGDHGGHTSVADSFDTAMCSMDATGNTVDGYPGARDGTADGEEARAAERRESLSISNELSDIIVRSGGVRGDESRNGEVVDDVDNLEDFVNGIVSAVDGDESHDFGVEGENEGGDGYLDSPLQEIEINIFKEQPRGCGEGGEETTAESPAKEVDILDRMQSYMNKVEIGASSSPESSAEQSPAEAQSLSASCAGGEDKSPKPNDESEAAPSEDAVVSEPEESPVSPPHSSPNLQDVSMVSESMFMPNMSPVESPGVDVPPPAEASAPSEQATSTMLDESSTEEETDELAFFPDIVSSVQPKVAARPLAKKQTVQARPTADQKKAVSGPSSYRKRSPSFGSAYSNSKPAAAAKPKPTKTTPSSRLMSARSTKSSGDMAVRQPRKVSSATLKRRSRLSTSAVTNATTTTVRPPTGRKSNPLWSPPSSMKPARKRPKQSPTSLQASSSADAVVEDNAESGAADMSLTLMDMTLNDIDSPVEKKSALVTDAKPQQADPEKKSVRTARVDAGKRSAPPPRGKENNTCNGLSRSDSMRQSLVNMTRTRREMKSNLPVPKKGYSKERLERLSKPRKHSVAPPRGGNSVSSRSTARSRASSKQGPPSFLSRTNQSRPAAKSTAELEAEEMRKVKPFKASKILGNPAEVRSRFMNPRPSQPSRQEKDSPSKYRPAATRPPSNFTRESVLLRTTPVRKKVSTFGESMVQYLNNGLRGVPSPSISPSKRGQLTKPRTPKLLSRSTHSSAVKSTEEIELEECRRQFRANPMPGGSSYRSTSLNRRTTTSARLTRSSEEIEMDECHKQFRAKPLPDPVSRSSLRRETVRHELPRNLTTPVPFNLHTNLRDTRPVPPSTDEVELSRQFKARPMPNSTTSSGSSFALPLHIRSQQQCEQSRKRSEARHDSNPVSYFKAKPVPKTTYEAKPVEMKTARHLTQPRPPRLSLGARAIGRRMYNDAAEEWRESEDAAKELDEMQKKEQEEEEIRMKRQTYLEDGGLCFKARQISIDKAIQFIRLLIGTDHAAARPSLRPARGEDPEAVSVRAAGETQAEVRQMDAHMAAGETERYGGIEIVQVTTWASDPSDDRTSSFRLRPGVD